jgi:hypothetical protein
MIDDQISGLERIDLLGIASHTMDGVSHSRQIYHRRHTGEILHEDARRRKRDLLIGIPGRVPARQGLNIPLLDRSPILEAQHVFQKDFDRER